MKTMKKLTISAAFLLVLTMLLVPLQAKDPGTPDPVPPFENTEGMTLTLIYFYVDGEGNEQVAGKAERAIIPAGTSAVTVELQKIYLPEGYQLKDPKDHPLTEDTLEVKIQVETTSDPVDPPEEIPTEPEAPTEPSEKPEDKPTEKPENQPDQKPTEKPENQPDQKPTEKPGKPTGKPTDKPQRPPQKPQGKPDPTNPQTGDGGNLSFWMFSLLSSACSLIWMTGKKKSAR